MALRIPTIKILLVHNFYQQSGGEDTVLESELQILSKRNESDLLTISNNEIKTFFLHLKVATNSHYSSISRKNISLKLSQRNYDVVHVHNFFPILTPSIYDACIEASVPVVQTLHNFRTICPGALLLRNGKVCEKCITGNPYQAMFYRCYRNSILGSLSVARMVAYHRKRKTWKDKVNRFIALTDFAKSKFVEAGFPDQKIIVKPNFYNYSSEVRGQRAENNLQNTAGRSQISEVKSLGTEKRKGALFVGRLSPEKGVETMLSAWTSLYIPLRIAGDGPLLDYYCTNRPATVNFLGRLSGEQVSHEMKQASFLIMPSQWYEGFPMVLVEAFAHDLPVIASRLGSMAEIVQDGVTGLHFEPGNPEDLADKVRWMDSHPEECRRMGENAYQEYLAKYTPEKNYKMLIDIYEQAIEEKKASMSIRRN